MTDRGYGPLNEAGSEIPLNATVNVESVADHGRWRELGSESEFDRRV